MTLNVDFDHFAEAVKRHLATKIAYVCRRESRTIVAAADPAANLIVSCSVKQEFASVKATLEKAGLEVAQGAWDDGTESSTNGLEARPFVAAVAYASDDEMPGVWVDAYATLPTQALVLKALYEEFRQTGEVGDVSFEEFVRQANPNVVIVSPQEIDTFLEEKEREC